MKTDIFSVLEKYKNNRTLYISKLSMYVSNEKKLRISEVLNNEYSKLLKKVPYYTYSKTDENNKPIIPDNNDEDIDLTTEEKAAIENNTLVPTYKLWVSNVDIDALITKDYVYNRLSSISMLHLLYAYKATNNIHNLVALGSIPLDKIITLLKYEYSKTIQEIADKKHDYVNTHIAGKEVSRNQVTVYKDKYKLAVECVNNDDYSVFELEAEFTGIDAEELVNLIIEKGNQWRHANNIFLTLIEAARVKAVDIIFSLEIYDDVIYVENILDKLNKLKITATPDKIKNVFIK